MILDISLKDKIIETDIFNAALQEIDIVFTTVNTELLGEPDFGCYFDEYLWTMTPVVESLKSYIYEKLSNCYYISQLNCNVDVVCSQSEEIYESVYTIKISLYNDYKSVQKDIVLGK
jgi:hypothetical protein